MKTSDSREPIAVSGSHMTVAGRARQIQFVLETAMTCPGRTGTDPDEARARILKAAEEQFRRIGYQKTSVADIASELGMSPANVYRFFPSRDAINESICGRVVNEAADIAVAIARTNAPAMEKLDRILTAVHGHNKMTLVKQKHMHDLVVAATQENW